MIRAAPRGRAGRVGYRGFRKPALNVPIVRAVTPDRCNSQCVNMPFGVAFSLYELGEFTVGHIHRHRGQVDRTLGNA